MVKLLLRTKGYIIIEKNEFPCRITNSTEGKKFEIESPLFPLYKGETNYKDGKYFPEGNGCVHIHYSDTFKVRVCGLWTDGSLSRGTIFSPENNYYHGKLKMLKAHGKGTLYNKNDEKLIEGTWQDGFPLKAKKFNIDGTVKYDGYFYRGKYNGMGILYQKNRVKEGLFQNGTFKISKEDLLKQKRIEQNIKKYLSQNRQQYLEKINEQDIKDYLKKYAKKQVNGTKQELIEALKEFKKSLNKSQTMPQSKMDPLTFEIIQKPVIANDGVIYDKSTMQSILGDYLTYRYNSKHQLVPNYRILAGGVPVSKYYTLQQLRTNTSIPKRQQFIQKLERF